MKHVILSALLTSFAAASCARDYSESNENYIRSVESSPAKTPAKPQPKGGNTNQASDERRELIQYVLRLSDESNPVTPEDRAIFHSLVVNPPAGSFQEAAGIVGAIRLSLAESSQPRFEEQDLKNPNAPQTPTSPSAVVEPSFEALAKSKGLQVDQALDRNIVIKTVKVYRLALEALKKTKNSPEFHDRVWNVIQNEAKEWAALIETPVPEAGANASEDGSTTTPDLPKMRYSPADLRQGDATLAEADRLADEGNYKEAIEVASSIVPEDPFYEPAQEKIRLFSNRAVQSLRERAAAAFQSAQPAINTREKAAFLQEARKYLEEALNDYPKAEHLDTVRENLAVITSNLDKLGVAKQ